MSSAAIVQIRPGWLRVSGDLNVYSVPDVLSRSQRMFDESGELNVDFSGVTRADSAALALLLEWISVARAKELRLTFSRVPASVMDIARVSNVAGLLTQGIRTP